MRLFYKSGVELVLVSQRLKRLVSIIYKLDLNENMGHGGMQDIGWYRAVLKDTKNLLKLKKYLSNNNSHKLEKIVYSVEKPKKSGYKSIHFIYTYNSKNIKYDGLKLELQIRNKLQHIWATAVETAWILTKTSLKSSQCPDEWLEFFKILSSLFTIKEKQPVLPEHQTKSMIELMLKCEKSAEKLKVTDILKALRVSAKQIESGKFNGDFYIININAKEKVVNIRGYKKKQFALASQDYLEIEKTIDTNNNAVV